MRFIIMHMTDAHWEAGALPSAQLIARVGGLMRELAAAGALLSGEGLRPSSQGARLVVADGASTVVPGPFARSNELPAGFSIVRTSSLTAATEWAAREAEILGDGELDIRPVTEPWDIGMASKPADVSTRRYMVLRKGSAATEAGMAPTPAQRSQLLRLIEETTRSGVHMVTEHMRPSAKGRRFKNSRDGVTIFDGPFIETKELIGGYVIVSAGSLDDASRWAAQYLAVVEAAEVDVRELE